MFIIKPLVFSGKFSVTCIGDENRLLSWIHCHTEIISTDAGSWLPICQFTAFRILLHFRNNSKVASVFLRSQLNKSIFCLLVCFCVSVYVCVRAYVHMHVHMYVNMCDRQCLKLSKHRAGDAFASILILILIDFH